MLFKLVQYWQNYSPRFKGLLFKFLMQNKNLKIGDNFKCDNFPKITISDFGNIEIGNNVYFKRDVELRSHQYSKLIFRGNNRIDIGVRVLGANRGVIDINENVRIGLYSVLNGGDNIYVGQNCLISGFVYLQTSNHRFDQVNNIKDQGYIHKPIKIEKDCWLAAHAVVLPGIHIAKGAVVGSNSVVTKDITPNSINGGVPSKFLKNRYAQD